MNCEMTQKVLWNDRFFVIIVKCIYILLPNLNRQKKKVFATVITSGYCNTFVISRWFWWFLDDFGINLVWSLLTSVNNIDVLGFIHKFHAVLFVQYLYSRQKMLMDTWNFFDFYCILIDKLQKIYNAMKVGFKKMIIWMFSASANKTKRTTYIIWFLLINVWHSKPLLKKKKKKNTNTAMYPLRQIVPDLAKRICLQ